ncbi:MAG: GtrA family protein [Promethearchaeota archaeon]
MNKENKSNLENIVKEKESIRFYEKYRQQILYFSFAVCMIILNYTIQWFNVTYISLWVADRFGHISFIQKYYLAKEPYDMTELIGSIVAVGITYITKFILDKFIVFQKKQVQLAETSKEFIKYFLFAILTTIENLGIQFILSNFLNSPLILSVVIALTCGYITKFLLDRKYVFGKK